jgi:hypothetical protein
MYVQRRIRLNTDRAAKIMDRKSKFEVGHAELIWLSFVYLCTLSEYTFEQQPTNSKSSTKTATSLGNKHSISLGAFVGEPLILPLSYFHVR